ncbi:MAG: hypothetical protein IT458_03455 [Planctomycetes bacterium]|nr:hypothetical protein [Planctomycetota bacterium]
MRRQWTVALPADVTAWLVAEAARRHFPDADPVPLHAHPRVWRLGPDRFRLRYVRDRHAGYRCDANGRLATHATEADSAAADPWTWPTIVFQPEPATLGLRGPIHGTCTVEVRAAGEGRTEVDLLVTGASAAAGVATSVAEILGLAGAVTESAQRLDLGDPSGALEAVAFCLAAPPALAHRMPRRILARAHFHAGLARTALAQPAEARLAIARAVALDPAFAHARSLLAATDGAQARPNEQLAELHALAQDRDGSWLAVEARRAAVSVARLARGNMPGRTHPAEAQRRLLAGDAPAALAWWEQSLVAGAPAPASLRAKAAFLRSGGHHREAYELGLQLLAQAGPDPELLLALHGDAVVLGLTEQGVHLLLAHWDSLMPAHREPVLAALGRATAQIGTSAMVRLARAHGSDAARDPSLVALLQEHGNAPAVQGRTARLGGLRSESAARLEQAAESARRALGILATPPR